MGGSIKWCTGTPCGGRGVGGMGGGRIYKVVINNHTGIMEQVHLGWEDEGRRGEERIYL